MNHAQILAIVVAWLAATGIPAVVDLVTKSHLSHRLKALLALVLAAVAGAITNVVYTAGESWTTYAFAILGAFVVAIATHATGYTDSLQAKTAALGIGPSSTPADPLRSTS